MGYPTHSYATNYLNPNLYGDMMDSHTNAYGGGSELNAPNSAAAAFITALEHPSWHNVGVGNRPLSQQPPPSAPPTPLPPWLVFIYLLNILNNGGFPRSMLSHFNFWRWIFKTNRLNFKPIEIIIIINKNAFLNGILLFFIMFVSQHHNQKATT